MADPIVSVDPFTAMANSRLHADEREFKAKVLSEIAALKGLVTTLVAKLEAQTKSK